MPAIPGQRVHAKTRRGITVGRLLNAVAQIMIQRTRTATDIWTRGIGLGVPVIDVGRTTDQSLRTSRSKETGGSGKQSGRSLQSGHAGEPKTGGSLEARRSRGASQTRGSLRTGRSRLEAGGSF